MKRYEAMYIVNASLDDESRTAAIEAIQNVIVSNGGVIEKTDEWGMRDFAYRIEDMTKGYYVVVTFSADANALSEFDRLTGINQNVVRHMIVNLEA
ncbi:MAG: 30S ribosomal protein S6 [Erysipelotrichaceae bacterium]|jgi:small subunit ribosomal protein S6|nr:30S ribosomal protein S6 [Erysipelotrichaceae bacterium]